MRNLCWLKVIVMPSNVFMWSFLKCIQIKQNNTIWVWICPLICPNLWLILTINLIIKWPLALKQEKKILTGKYPNSFHVNEWLGFPRGAAGGKEPTCQCRREKRCRFHPCIRKVPWRKARNPLQYSSLKNPMDRGSGWATVHRVAKSRTQIKQLSTHVHTTDYFKHIRTVSLLLALLF